MTNDSYTLSARAKTYLLDIFENAVEEKFGGGGNEYLGPKVKLCLIFQRDNNVRKITEQRLIILIL